ncbi:AAA family ATPase [Ramlibacter sp. G-1-2-2]|uniref:AAA family ATPase n=1 Tax=Ramlibacter agri TaxID=2728837 RepID=A0A848H2L8_9BURK|nr:AAA family ATPase [Ramlibacter agri]
MLPAAGAAPAEAERRWVTVMFCDLVGSVALSERLEPEDLRALLGHYQRACKAAVELHGGSIARYVGDGLLICFGHPRAHEDAPLRAVRAALDIVAAVRKLKVPLAGHGEIDLQVRVGIETGSVLIGHIDRAAAVERDAVVGTVPNMAARLQSLAAPNRIVVGEATYHRIRDSVQCRSAGQVTLKGIARPVAVYTVDADGAEGDPFLRRAERLFSPLVERDAQRETLRSAWQRAKGSVPGVLAIAGEAGVGKSRLVRAFVDELQGDNFNHVAYRCAAQHQGSPLHPAAAQLQAAFGLDAPAENAQRLARLKDGVARLGLPAHAVAPLAMLAGVDAGTGPTAPTELRRETLETLAALVAAHARLAPTLMVVEDLHWCDPSTLEFLQSLVERALPPRLLLVVTHRPDFVPPWGEAEGRATLSLQRLSAAASRNLVRSLLAGREVPAALVEKIVERAEGNPLFLEEFTSLLADAGNEQEAAAVTIPDSLQESLATRLDRIGAAKRIAQVAAAYGRAFSLAHLAALPDFRGLDIAGELDELARKGLLAPGAGLQDEYEFSHALIRDAAYQSMVREDRKAVHLRIAESFEAHFPEIVASRPELVAQHFSEGERRERAIGYWYRAGARAMERLANVESIEHLRRGLAQVDALDPALRPMQELGFLTALMPALCATRGYANAEVQQTFSRAFDLCTHIGPTAELATVLYGLWSYYLVRADLARSRQLATEMQRIAGADVLRQMEGELAAGLTSFYEGRLQEAAGNFEAILALWRPDGPQFFTAGEDVRASTKSWLAIVYWHQGEVDRARDVAQESLYRARQVGQPISLAFALYFNVFLAHFCRDLRTVKTLGRECLALCTEKHLFWGALCVLQLGWGEVAAAGADREGMAAGIRHMHEGLGGYRGAGARLTQTYYLATIAEAQLKAGALEDCERSLGEGFAAAEESGEQLSRSELLRLRADLALALGADADAVATLYASALGHARSTGARSLELRAALGWARVLKARERDDELPPLLEPLLASIKCMAPTAEIAEARGLLQAVSA